MVEAIYRDGPIVTKVALCGVIGLVLVMFGVRGSPPPPVLLSLFIGIVWWGGLLGYLSLKLNLELESRGGRDIRHMGNRARGSLGVVADWGGGGRGGGGGGGRGWGRAGK